MYLVQYKLQLGPTSHYAPSARAAARLIRDVETSGGSVISITRTRDKVALSPADLGRIADTEVASEDSKGSPLLEALRRLLLGRGGANRH